jgi:hypothetical protein
MLLVLCVRCEMTGTVLTDILEVIFKSCGFLCQYGVPVGRCCIADFFFLSCFSTL